MKIANREKILFLIIDAETISFYETSFAVNKEFPV